MNMKEIYVINLNKKRVLFLSGVLFVLLGTILWLGLSIGSARSNNFTHRDNFSSIAEELGINNKELKSLNLSETSTGLGSSPPDFSPLQVESKKVAPIQNSIELKENKTSKLDVRDHDPLEKTVKQNNVKDLSNEKKDKVFVIQIAAFRRKKHATALLKRMQTAGFLDARIDQGARYYYVRMGRSASKKALISKNNRVKQLFNIKTLIVQQGGANS